jgi:hypothetical protein
MTLSFFASRGSSPGAPFGTTGLCVTALAECPLVGVDNPLVGDTG